MKIIGLLVTLCSALLVYGQPSAKLNGDTLVLLNTLIERQFLWNDGELVSIGLTDKSNRQQLLLPSDRSAFDFEEKPVKADFSSRNVKANSIYEAHLQAEVVLYYPGFTLKRIFRIYHGVPVIACDYYLWVEPGEEKVGIQKLGAKPLVMDQMVFAEKHVELHAIEFFDQTDNNNNLVREETAIPFRTQIEMRGNILKIGLPGNKKAGVFLLKEAPGSTMQLNYPGYDFRILRNAVTIEGVGLSADDLVKGQWLKLYGSVAGCFNGTELGFLSSLRKYQKSLRRVIPERDDMIMMNTWGDRNKDASVNEQFLKEEVDACDRLGITHFQVDDGWQQGLSKNSANAIGEKWEMWQTDDWKPHKERLPHGFRPIVKYAKKKGVQLGLWFNPSSHNSFESWERDADILLGLYHKYDIRYFKIDGIQLPDKLADHRLRLFFDKLVTESNGEIVVITDVTAGRRTGYHYLNSYGVTFLENRYTDWHNYYPHWTLRNLWQLSAYVPSEKLQIEFLNKWRNAAIYGEEDPLAPAVIPFEYQFAITMMAQPLAWFEGSKLPEKAFAIAPVIKKYRSIQSDLHSGKIFPIGEEPTGYSWTGFQSIIDDTYGYLLVFRENHPDQDQWVSTWLPENTKIGLTPIVGDGEEQIKITNDVGKVKLFLPNNFSYCLFRYEVLP